MWFDTHAHLNDARFDDLPDVLTRMREAGVTHCVCAAEDIETGRSALALARVHRHMYAIAGIHPHNASRWDEDTPVQLRTLLAQPKMVALGEIGLDFHYDFSPRDVQKKVFVRQLEMAITLGLPVVYHVREAYGETMDILLAHKAELPKGVMHCFSGSWEWGKQCLDLGLYLSLSGSVTFKNAPKLWEVAEKIPLDRLLVETDSPYMAPVPHRGKRNEPTYVPEVGRKIATLRGVDEAIIAEATMQNALDLFLGGSEG